MRTHEEVVFERKGKQLEKIMQDKSIVSVAKDESGKFTIKYDNGQEWHCSGILPDNHIYRIFSNEVGKKKQLF
jgi:hypothetical protein